ncbi:hypothetical protein [Cellulosimicrobium arenosum]|uniref:Uncharacterized protein n=1 Tax=Cellulosimicrobium arenosum TaxID=2708133 RepID=A0A927IXB7_9MICO|nr:hypothetical protein [Cellulosimicrobium arenosum]MBD8078066.1 hypothetical protein [Cellulosimicrobium arenosum]
MTTRATALVESPLQLLGTLEAVHAGVVPAPVEVRWRSTVPGLRAAVAAVGELGAEALPPGIVLVAAGRPSARDLPSRDRDHAVGDVFSGRAQVGLAAARPGRLVLLDDGLATIEAVRLLGGGGPLVRLGRSARAPRRLLGARVSRRIRTLAARPGRVVLCTALDLAPADAVALDGLGIEVTRHAFGWVAGLPPAPAVPEPLVVVGSALVADGLVDPDAYVRWVAALADAADGGTCYIPHRRHDAGVLARLAALPGVRVAPPGPPVELRLRSLDPSQRVVCLPSTAHRFLRQVLRGSGARVELADVPAHWWTERADARLRDHLVAAAAGEDR